MRCSSAHAYRDARRELEIGTPSRNLFDSRDDVAIVVADGMVGDAREIAAAAGQRAHRGAERVHVGVLGARAVWILVAVGKVALLLSGVDETLTDETAVATDAVALFPVLDDIGVAAFWTRAANQEQQPSARMRLRESEREREREREREACTSSCGSPRGV